MGNYYFQNRKLEKEAVRHFVKYLADFDLYKEYLPESTYSGLREEILSHIEEKIEESPSKKINLAEAKIILGTLGSVNDLLKEFHVPKLINLPILGSSVGFVHARYKLFQISILLVLVTLIMVAARDLYLTISMPENPYSYTAPEDLRSQWTVSKSHKKQDFEVIFPSKNMRVVYVYHGRDLKDEEMFLQFTGGKNYQINTTTEPSDNPYGKMVVEIYSEKEEAPFTLTDNGLSEEIDSSMFPAGFQELIIFVPEQLNFKGTFSRLPERTVPSDEPKYTLTELYLEKGITPYVTPHRNEFDSNTTFGYVEQIKNAEKIKVSLEYLGEYTPTTVDLE